MDTKINDARVAFEKLGYNYDVAKNVQIEEEMIDDIPCYWFYNGRAKSHNSVILYLHGGCYALGSVISHKALVSHLSNETNTTFLFIDYSLAPEYPFPTAVNEVLSVYNYLVHKVKVQNISFFGDSAGAGLTVSIVSILNRQKNTENLRRVVMISPWIDLRNNNDSIEGNRKIDPILSKESLDLFSSLYVGNKKMSEVNPMETLFGTFPPTLILVGSDEILLDDSKTIFSRIVVNQPITNLTIYPNQTHVWLMDSIESEATIQAFNEIRIFNVQTSQDR